MEGLPQFMVLCCPPLTARSCSDLGRVLWPWHVAPLLNVAQYEHDFIHLARAFELASNRMVCEAEVATALQMLSLLQNSWYTFRNG